MRAGLALGMLALIGAAGCSRVDQRDQALEDAQEQLAFLDANGGSGDEMCKARRAVQQAQLELRDSEGYRTAKVFADSACASAALEGRF
jgi:hypothetical protein